MVKNILSTTHKKITFFIVSLLSLGLVAIAVAPSTQALASPQPSIVAAGVDISEGDPQCPTNKAPATGQGSNCIVKHILRPFLVFLTSVAAVFVVIQIIIGGIQYSSAAGDSSKVAAARKRIGNAVFTIIAFIFLWAFLQYLIPGGVSK